MSERHIKAAAELEKACFSVPWSEENLREELGRGIFLVAEQDDEVLGYAGCQTVLDEGYITNVAVSPHRRGEGIGYMLMCAMLERAKEKKLSFVTLEVRPSNLPAHSLYRKLKFEKVGVRKGFYQKPKEDAELWKLNL